MASRDAVDDCDPLAGNGDADLHLWKLLVKDRTARRLLLAFNILLILLVGHMIYCGSQNI